MDISPNITTMKWRNKYRFTTIILLQLKYSFLVSFSASLIFFEIPSIKLSHPLKPSFIVQSMAKITRVCCLLFRVLAFGATLSSIIVMSTSHETVSFFTVSFEANYTNSSAFKYFVIANSVVAVYGFLVLFVPSGSFLGQFVIFFDLVFTILLTSSISAALAMAYVGKKGNRYAGWLPICGQVPKYCHQVAGALASSFVALIMYIILLFHSIYTTLPLLQVGKT